jgi:hypothetical protein
VTGVLDVVVGLVDLPRARERVLAAAVGEPEPARVHVPHVERRRPFDDPLGDELPHATGAGEAVCAEAGGHPEAPDVSRPEDELAVRSERLGAVDELHDLHLRERGDTHDCVLHELLEAGPVLLEETGVELRRDAVEPPRRAVALVATHDQATRFRPEVHEERGVTHRRHLERKTRRLGDEVLVCHRHDRHLDAGERPDLLRVHPARVYNDVAVDGSAIRLHACDTAAPYDDVCDARAGGDLRSSAARAFRERERELARIDVAVRREERGAEDVFGRHRREERMRLVGRDQLEREPEGLCPSGLARDLLHALKRGREPQRAHFVPARLEADLVLERSVEVDARHHHLRERQRAPQLADEAGGMERRPARELRPLDEDDVVPAEARQPVEDGAAADAPTDHHRPGSAAHGAEP